MSVGRGATLAALAMIVVLGLPGAALAKPVRRGFFGVVPQGPLSASDFGRMQGTIGSVRLSFGWSDAEPRPDKFEFGSFDKLVAEAARHRIQVLPFVSSSPRWLTGDHERPPLGTARARREWRSFLRRLVLRYGPGGSFWRGRRTRMPIRRWQIWNEPNFLLAWHPRISPRGYARLLGIAARAIRGVDPNATIFAAAVAPVEAGMLPWNFVRRMYSVPGVKRSFDLMAVNPYSPSVVGVAYEIRRIRHEMSRAGDGRKQLRVTELGVASDGAFPNPFDRGARGQARFLRDAYRLLLGSRRRWRIEGVDWFAWQDLGYTDTHCVFCQYAGLIDLDGRAKPSWHALRRLVTRTGVRATR